MSIVKPVSLLTGGGGGGGNAYSTNLTRSTTDYWSISDAAQTGLDITGSFSVCGWFRLASLPTTQGYGLIGKAKLTTPNEYCYHAQLYQSGGNYIIQLYVSETASASVRDAYDYTLSYTPSIGSWYFLGITFDITAAVAARPTFYEGATNKGSGTLIAGTGVSSIYNATSDFWVGRLPYSSNLTLDGDMDEWNIWNGTVLSDAEMATMAAGGAAPAGGWSGGWSFENNANDNSGNGNTLSANGSPTFTTSVPY